jgi:CHAD domain-containing protein
VPRAVHQARTTSRRLRELLPVVAAAAPGAGAARLRRDARRVTRALGPVRELDVALAVVAGHVARQQKDWTGVAVVRLQRELEIERERRREHMREELETLDPGKWRERTEGLIAAVVAAPPIRVWERALGERLRRRAERLAQAVSRAGMLYVPEALHVVRIASKKLRYTLELAHDAMAAPVTGLIGPLRETQDVLGRIHDLHVLDQWMRRAVSGPADAGRVREAVRLGAALDCECRELHGVFLAHRAALVAIARQVAQDVAPGLMGRRPRTARWGAAGTPVRRRKGA